MGHDPTIAIRDFTGDLDFDPAAPGRAMMRLQIRADSLEVTDEIKRKDRKEMESTMNREVLDSAKYPIITFQAAGVSAKLLSEGRFQIAMQGSLELRGTTGRVPLTAQLTFFGDMFRASGEFSILQSNYGIPLVSVAGGALEIERRIEVYTSIWLRESRNKRCVSPFRE